MGSNTKKVSKGFTLIEILVVIGIIAVLAAIVIVAINPARQFAQARNSQRTSNVNAILNAIGQDIADNKGIFTCSGGTGTLPSAAVNGVTPPATSEISGAEINLRPCLVPTYIPELVVDPNGGTNTCSGGSSSCTTYATKYFISQDSTGRITVCAPGGQEGAIAGSATICVTR